jgi:hypothetical protein
VQFPDTPIVVLSAHVVVEHVRAVVEPKGNLITPAIWRKRLSIGWD